MFLKQQPTCPGTAQPCRIADFCASQGCREASPKDTDTARMRDTTDLRKIRAAARRFIERYGDDAPRQASIRAAELNAVGELEGYARWQLIERESNRLLLEDNSEPSFEPGG